MNCLVCLIVITFKGKAQNIDLRFSSCDDKFYLKCNNVSVDVEQVAYIVYILSLKMRYGMISKHKVTPNVESRRQRWDSQHNNRIRKINVELSQLTLNTSSVNAR